VYAICKILVLDLSECLRNFSTMTRNAFHLPYNAKDTVWRSFTRRLVFSLLLPFRVVACHRQRTAPVTGPFSGQELQQFVALNPAFYAMLNRLNLHILDIVVIDDTNSSRSSLPKESQAAWKFVNGSKGRVSVCTTFDPYDLNRLVLPIWPFGK
jgi:hypothetical protein